MKSKKQLLLSWVLSTAIIFSNVSPAFASDNKPDEKELRKKVTELQNYDVKNLDDYKEEDSEKDVRVVVELKDKPVLQVANERGVDIQDFDKGQAEAIKNDLLQKQESVKEEIESKIETKDQIKDEVKADDNFTQAFNGFSTYVKLKDIDTIKENKQVKEVYISNEYHKPEVSKDMFTSNEMVNSSKAWDLNYKGDKTVVAVIDSGVDPSHPDLTLDENVDVALTEETVNNLHNEGKLPGKYFTKKVPYGYNYYDLSDNIKDIGDSQHGQHVAGTVAANGKIKGVAPHAQVLAMKVFSDDVLYSTTFSDIYMKAIDDSILLGADAINMSLGSAAGTWVNNSMEDVALQNAVNNGVVCAISAGNEHTVIEGVGNVADLFNGSIPYAFSKNPDIGMLGSPSVYPSSLSVASIDNTHQMSNKIEITVNGQTKEVQTSPAAGAPNAWEELTEGFKAGEIVDVKGPNGSKPGDLASFEKTDKEVGVEGKLCMVERGNTFTDTITNAMQFGAKAVIVYNNERKDSESLINMAGGELAKIPFMMIGRNGGLEIVNNLDKEDLTVKFPEELMSSENPTAGEISSFSSWGTTPSLQIKPEIAAPGGKIYSLQNGDKYTTMSGTSMASPHVAGGAALVSQRVKNEEAVFGKLEPQERSRLVKNILMNTAKPAKDPDGVYYLVRQQGAGLMDVESAVKTLQTLVNNETDEAKVELKDFEDTKFALTLKVTNYSDKAINYDIELPLLTDYTEEAEDGYTYNLEAPKLLENYSYDTKTVSVDAKSETTFTINVDFTEAVNKKEITRNSFVEGFVLLKAKEEAEDLTLPFLGFYGNWDEPTVLDEPEYNLNDEDKSNDPMFNTTRLVVVNGNGNVSIPEKSNPTYFNPEAGFGVALMTSILRNHEKVTFKVKDENGDELFNIGQSDGGRKITRMSQGAKPIKLFIESLWNGIIGSKPLENGKKVVYEVQAYRTEKSKPQTMKFDVIMDTKEPEVNNISYEKDTLTFDAHEDVSEIGQILVINEKDFSLNRFQAKDYLVSGTLKDGKFKIPFRGGLKAGTYRIAAADIALNFDLAYKFEVDENQQGLDAPVVEQVDTETTKVIGKTYENAQVVVETTEKGKRKEIGKATADDKGNFEVEIGKQKEGTLLYVYAKVEDRLTPEVVLKVFDNQLKAPQVTTVIDNQTTKIVGNAFWPKVKVTLSKVNKKSDDSDNNSNDKVNDVVENVNLDGEVVVASVNADEDGKFEFKLEEPFEAQTLLRFKSEDEAKKVQSPATEIEVNAKADKELSEYGQSQIFIEAPKLLNGYNSDVPFKGYVYGWEKVDSLTFKDHNLDLTQEEKTSIINPNDGGELWYGRAFKFDQLIKLEDGYYADPLVAKAEGKEDFSVTRRFYVDTQNPIIRLNILGEDYETNDKLTVKVSTEDRSALAKFNISDNLNTLKLYKETGILKTSDITWTKDGMNATDISDEVSDPLQLHDGLNVYDYELEDVAGNITSLTIQIEKIDKSELRALYEEVSLLEEKPEELQTALDNAKTVLDNPNATQQEIDAAVEAIKTAVENLPEAPFIMGATNFEIEQYDELTTEMMLRGVRAYDYQDGDITDKIVVEPETIDTSKPGYVIVTYSVTDSDGNTSSTKAQLTINEKAKELADITNLQEAIRKALQTVKENYTEDSYTNLEKAMDSALPYLSGEYSQEEVDQKTQELLNLLDSLVDISKLRETIVYATGLDLENVTLESFETLKKALDEAKTVLENPSATNEEVQNALNNLVLAIDGLEEVKPVDKEELKKLYEKAALLDLEQYDPESANNLKQEMMLAKTVLEDENTTQEIVDETYEKLNNAISNLVKKDQADKTKLEKLLDEAKSVNTSYLEKDLQESLTEAIRNGQTVLEKKDATKEEVLEATVKLEDVLNKVKDVISKLPVDFTQLKALVARAKTLDFEKLDKDLANELKEALLLAEKILDDPETTREQVDETTDKLANLLMKVDENDTISLKDEVKNELKAYSDKLKEKLDSITDPTLKQKVLDVLDKYENALKDPDTTLDDLNKLLYEMKDLVNELDPEEASSQKDQGKAIEKEKLPNAPIRSVGGGFASGTPATKGKGKSAKANAKTGAKFPAVAVAVLVVAAGAYFVTTKRNKK